MPRIRPPAWIKPVAVPIWNSGWHIAWRLGEYAGAVRHKRFGRCTVCGRFGPWLYRPRVVAPKLVELWGLTPQLTEALARKESLDCAWCGAKLRTRRMAEVLLSLYPSSAHSIAEWVRDPAIRALRVAEINLIEGLHTPLSLLPHYAFSDFSPGAGPGEVVSGVRSEDLTRLTYPDASLDVVLTSESLEHVPDLDASLGEIRRILVSGGRHVFTIPVLPGVPTTYARMVLRPDGSIEERAPRICHPGGDVGYPVFTEFGADVMEVVRLAGFEVDVWFGPVRDDDLGQVYVARRTP